MVTERSSQVDHEIEGTLNKIVYRDDSSLWSVLKLTQEDNDRIITVIGTFIGVHPGERLRIQGRWTDSPEFGEQFAADSYVSLSPKTLNGIQHYLASGFIDGIGSKMSANLVKAFGLDLPGIIENHPGRLTEVPGIGKIRARRISKAWKQHNEVKNTMIFLQSHGISGSYATRIIKAYGKRTVPILQENPYRLCFDIFGIGFKTADKIARNLGVDPASPKRAQAGLFYVLGTLSEKGHMCYPFRQLVAEAGSMLEIPRTTIHDALEMLRIEGQVVVEEQGDELLVYLKALYDAEEGTAVLLKSLLKEDARHIPIDSKKALLWFESGYHITLAPEQKDAVSGAIEEKALVITGGPGTGKTTLIKGIIKIFEKKGARVHLCAPTGRAAKRMSEATGHDARTIHRLFEITPSFVPDGPPRDHKLKTDMLIIDEASMMDTMVFHHVLAGLAPHARLILVGDADQLPSVGPGNVLGDIIKSGLIKTIRLERIFRQAKKSLIVVNAHRINQGLMPYSRSVDTNRDCFFVARDSADDALDVVKEMVSVRIPDYFGFDPFSDIQVLSPMHRGILGVSNLNCELQALLNSSKKALKWGSQRLFEGDKVMQIRNNYDSGVFNGDMGRIACIDTENKVLDVDFEDNRVRYERDSLDEIMLAYACSIHKAQGNEYPAVVIVLHTQHYIMLQRNLLYTAITRGKSLVAVVGNTKAVAIATANLKKGTRYSMLTNRLMRQR